jgi:acyl carrier protein
MDDRLVSPRNSTEQELADIWAEMLGVRQIGASSNFFDLGGHSLLAGRVLARVASVFGVSLPIRTLFDASTIEALAQVIDETRRTRAGMPALPAAQVQGESTGVVSIAQERVLGIEQALPGLPQFNVPYAFHLQGPLDNAALEQSLAEVMRRHDSLRTGFSSIDGRPVAKIASFADIGQPLIAVEDVAPGLAIRNKRAKALLVKKAELLAEESAWQPFHVSKAPLFRARLLRLGHDEHVFVLIMHHAIIDGWSIGIMFEEVSTIYSALTSSRPLGLPEQKSQFSDFANWQRKWCDSQPASQQIAFWRHHLRGATPLFSKDGDPTGAQAASVAARKPVNLSAELIARLAALGRRQDATLFMTLLAGFKTMLLARTARQDICIATIMANRTELWTEGVVGPLENTTLIRTRLDPDLSFRAALARVRETVLEAHARQHLPFEILASRLAQDDGVDPALLTQGCFVLQNAVRRPLELRNLAVRSFGQTGEGQPVLAIDQTWLTLMLKEGPSGISGSCGYKQDLLDTDTLQQWMADYATILSHAAADPERQLGRLMVD